MGLSTSLMKLLLFICNGILAVFAVVVIACGAVVIIGFSDVKYFMDSKITTGAYILVVVGIIMFIMTFIGIYGAIVENFLMLASFVIVVSIIFLAEVAASIVVMQYKGSYESELINKLWKTFSRYGKDSPETRVWDGVQFTIQCCGVYGPGDWPANGKKVPVSCCDISETFVVVKTATDKFNLPQSNIKCTLKDYYKDGCYNRIKSILLSKSHIVIAVGIGIAVIQIVGVLLSIFLAIKIRRVRRSRG